MSVSKILGEDWSDYESRKTSKDKNLVDATEPWETIYLKNKIKKFYPNLTDTSIIDAFTACCLSNATPCHRKTFFEYIAKKLAIPKK